MRVFVTGATGFVGSAIVPELLGAGHQVLGLARSDQSAAALQTAGAEVQRGTLEDMDSLRDGARATDGVIHAAFIHDFSQYEASIEADRKAVEAMVGVLAGTDKPLIVTSGALLVRLDRPATEEDAATVDGKAAGRGISEETVLAAEQKGVRGIVLRLPPSVHDKGDHGFVPTLIDIARQKGVSAYIGDGANRWPAVHRLDAAYLYRLALEKALAGTRLHAIADMGIPTREIAEVIGKHLNVPVRSVSTDDASEHFGWIAPFFGRDAPTSSTLTREWLDWQPTRPGLIEDLEQGHYFDK